MKDGLWYYQHTARSLYNMSKVQNTSMDKAFNIFPSFD